MLPTTYALEAPVTSDYEVARVTLVTDTLRLSAGGKAERRTRFRTEYADGRDTTATRTGPYVYKFKPGRVELTYVCGPAEFCAPAPHYVGRFEGGRLVLSPTLAPQPELHYRRVD